MLSLIITESSLELVPRELQSHISIKSHAKKLGKYPSEILLDNSWHFAAMKGIENEIKRGRPDIVHLCLLAATGIPLYHENEIEIYVHTIDNKVIILGDNVRLPKSYHRFAGIIEKLFKDKVIRTDDSILMELKKMTFAELIEMIEPKNVIALSPEGIPSNYQSVAHELDDSCLIVGGFQKGAFSDEISQHIDKTYSIGEQSFEAHVVISRILYEYEKTIFM